MSPSLAPLRSITVLATSVVPCTMVWTSPMVTADSHNSRSMPSVMARLGSPGVVSRLPMKILSRASSTSAKSVKVPPTSTPMRARMGLALTPGLRAVDGTLLGRLATSSLLYTGTGGASHVHAVVSYRRDLRHVAVPDVAPDRFTIALFGIVVAAATAVPHGQPFAGLDDGAGLGVRPGAVREVDGDRRARLAAGEGLRGMLLPVGDERQPHYLG